ncbi:hypothetical protein ACWIGW_39225 [Nocardia brasiliensis]
MIDIDAPEDVLVAAQAVVAAVRATARETGTTLDHFVLPDTPRCCLDAAGIRCVAWIRAIFDASLAGHTAAVVTGNAAVVRAIDELITTDSTMGARIRRSAGG